MYTKVNLKWVIGLNIKRKVIKLLGKKKRKTSGSRARQRVHSLDTKGTIY